MVNIFNHKQAANESDGQKGNTGRGHQSSPARRRGGHLAFGLCGCSLQRSQVVSLSLPLGLPVGGGWGQAEAATLLTLLSEWKHWGRDGDASLRCPRQLGEGRWKPRAPAPAVSFLPGHLVTRAVGREGMATSLCK